MPVIRNPIIPNYLLSCGSKRTRRPTSGNTSQASSSAASTRCSSVSDSERKISKFRTLCGQNHFPFEVDYSREPHPLTRKLHVAWKEQIQVLDLRLLIPELLEGYTDTNLKYHRVVDAALFDLLRHASLVQLYLVGMILRPCIKRLFATKRRETVLSALRALQHITRVIDRAASVNLQSLRGMLVPLNAYLLQYRNNFVDMTAQPESYKDLTYIVDRTLSSIETFASDLNRRYKLVKTVGGVYKGYVSKLQPEKSPIMNLKCTSVNKQGISNCIHLRRHQNMEQSWRRLNRNHINHACRDVLKLMPWIVPKNSNFHIPADDVRIVDMNSV